MTGAEPGPAAPVPDAENCLCLVVSYASVAPLLESITAEAASRLMMSPTLGDFIELRFASLGMPGDIVTEDSVPVRRITAELFRPRAAAGRSYFALVVVDRSAGAVEEVLAACAGSPLLAGLPLRLRGIASRAEPGDAAQPATPAGAEIVVAPAGSWRRNDLVNELRRYGDELLRQCAAGQHAGLSDGEIAALRARYDHDHTAAQPGPEQPAPTGSAGPAGPLPADPPPPGPAADVLEPEPQPSQPARPGQPGPGDQQMGASEHEPAAAAPPADPGTLASARPGRPRPWPRWGVAQPGRRAEPTALDASGEITEAAVSGIVYLLVTGETIVEDRAAWKRGRSALLDIDANIAAVAGADFQVRVLHGDEQVQRGVLRPAGQLARHDLKGPVSHPDFASVATEIRAMLDRERVPAPAPGTAPARPAVVFFAPDPPLAGPAAAQAFQELTERALVVWIVPKAAAELIAPAFTEAPGTRFLIDNDAVAGEVAALLAAAGAAAPMAGSHGA